jgi:hypothetical protein
MDARKLEDQAASANELLYVSDSGQGEWHVVQQRYLVVPEVHGWAVCGCWPSSPAGWRLVRQDCVDLRLHDTCRFWAGIGQRWVYVRAANTSEWHVVKDAELSGYAVALCGQQPHLEEWISATGNPAGLNVHSRCRALRDQVDFAVHESAREALRRPAD